MKQQAQDTWREGSGRLAPIGLLLHHRMARPSLLARWPGVAPRNVVASSSTGPAPILGPTPQRLSAMGPWLMAVCRQQTQPIWPSPMHWMVERPAPAIGDEMESDPRITQPVAEQRQFSPPTRTPLQLVLPRPGLHTPLALQGAMAVSPLATRKSAMQGPTPIGFVSRAAGGGLGSRSEPTASPRRVSHQVPGPVTWAAGSETGPERLVAVGPLPMAASLVGGRGVWPPLVLHHWTRVASTRLPMHARHVGPPSAAHVHPELSHRTPDRTPTRPEGGQTPDEPAGPRQFRSTVAREVALLVKEVTRVVEKRDRQIPAPPPQQAQPLLRPAPKLDAAEVFRLLERASRERAFRMGR